MTRIILNPAPVKATKLQGITIKNHKTSFLGKALSSKNRKEVWETVKRILDPPKNGTKHDPGDLNRYFTELASTLTDKEKTAFNKSLLVNILPELGKGNAFVIQHTTYTEVKNIISELRNDCSSGFDNIPLKFLNPVAKKIASPIVHIINSSIDKEIFPNSWKVARVCPVQKINNPMKEKDFTPISILHVLSKVYEKVILGQLNDYIGKSSVYNLTQSSFRKGHLTQTLLLKSRNDIQKALNRNKTMISVIDCSKAFDTIDHESLIRKFVGINFSNSSIKIILSYLTNRKQYVQLNDKQSTRLPIYFGVPQGSILGPVLLNIYVAKLSTCIESNAIQYADDANIYKSSSRANTITTIRTLENDMVLIWSKNNGLVFNNDKLKSIIFSSRKSNGDKSFLIRSKGKSVQQEPTVKLLGTSKSA